MSALLLFVVERFPEPGGNNVANCYRAQYVHAKEMNGWAPAEFAGSGDNHGKQQGYAAPSTKNFKNDPEYSHEPDFSVF